MNEYNILKRKILKKCITGYSLVSMRSNTHYVYLMIFFLDIIHIVSLYCSKWYKY